MVESRCGIRCASCDLREVMHCKGCIETMGNPFHGECPVARCAQEKNHEHCGECDQFPCKQLVDYANDPEHGDNGARVEQCRKWKAGIFSVAKYMGVCLSVSDMAVSKRFYMELLDQSIHMDLGANVSFGGFSLQEGFAEMLKIPVSSVVYAPNNAELYFEVEDVTQFQEKLNAWEDIEYVHQILEQPWKQRTIRFYDPDKHVVEVGEDMKAVVCRLLAEGATAEEVAAQTMMPLPFVQHCSSN